MISDINVIKYIYSMASDEPIYNKVENYSKDIFRAFANAEGKFNYENICNEILHDSD